MRRPVFWQITSGGPEFEALFEVIPAAFFKSIGYTAVASIMGGGLAGTGLPVFS